MSKKSKGFSAKACEKPVNFVPGWIGGRLTSPMAQQEAKDHMKRMMRDRVRMVGAIRERSHALPHAVEHDEPAAAFAP